MHFVLGKGFLNAKFNKLILFSSLEARTWNRLVVVVIISVCLVLTWISFGRRSSWRSWHSLSQSHWSWGFGGGFCTADAPSGGAPEAGSSMLSNARRASSWNLCGTCIWLCLYPCVAVMVTATKQTNKNDFMLALREVSSETSVWKSTCTLDEDRWVKTFYITNAENQKRGWFVACFWFVASRIVIGWIMHVQRQSAFVLPGTYTQAFI